MHSYYLFCIIISILMSDIPGYFVFILQAAEAIIFNPMQWFLHNKSFIWTASLNCNCLFSTGSPRAYPRQLIHCRGMYKNSHTIWAIKTCYKDPFFSLFGQHMMMLPIPVSLWFLMVQHLSFFLICSPAPRATSWLNGLSGQLGTRQLSGCVCLSL